MWCDINMTQVVVVAKKQEICLLLIDCGFLLSCPPAYSASVLFFNNSKLYAAAAAGSQFWSHIGKPYISTSAHTFPWSTSTENGITNAVQSMRELVLLTFFLLFSYIFDNTRNPDTKYILCSVFTQFTACWYCAIIGNHKIKQEKSQALCFQFQLFPFAILFSFLLVLVLFICTWIT